MMFDDRSSKFEREHEKMREIARKRRESEQKLKTLQLLREKEQNEMAEQRRMEKELHEQERLIEEENENRLTGGIKFQHVLKPYEIEGEDDKVILPESCLNDLSQQDVFGKGPVTFQIYDASNGERRSHCGVREFSAPEGTVGLPKKVIESLLVNANSTDVAQLSKVVIKYVKMSKVTFVKLQPKFNRFFDVGPVKMVLEENLRFHSTLTVGDQLTVWYRGSSHALLVVELRPDPQGNLFDTDVEVDLELSQEGEALRRHHAEEQQQEQDRRNKMTEISTAEKALISGKSAPSVFASFPSGQARTLNESNTSAPEAIRGDAALSSSCRQYAQLLLPESEEGAAGGECSLRIKIRLPNGKTVLRRFSSNSHLSQIFYFVGTELSLTEEQLNQVQLTSKAINRSFKLTAEERDKSFIEVGLTDSNIMLMMSM